MMRLSGKAVFRRTKSRETPAFLFPVNWIILLLPLPQRQALRGSVRRSISCIERHRSIVALTETVLEDAHVAAVVVGEARAQFVEHLADDVAIADAIERQAAVGQRGLLPSVMSGSTTRRSSLAFGSVVRITS